MPFPSIVFGTPRKLPAPGGLVGRVAVLDIAFASGTAGASFDTVTRPFIEGLGARLAVWIDHHDHVLHADFAGDPRFILRTKAQHGACPEMVTPERVAQAGPVDTVCCHTDFDGVCSAAKWVRGGLEPYVGADADARAIDTRMGRPSELARDMDRALRARPRDEGLRGLMVRFLAQDAADTAVLEQIREAAQGLLPREQEARRLALGYRVQQGVAHVSAEQLEGPYDKTLLLMLGQERARISVVYDATTVTAAARFDSGVDLLKTFGLEGGMPTVVSLPRRRLEEVLAKLGVGPVDE